MHDDTIEIRQPAADPESLRKWIRPVSTAFADEYTDAMFDIDRQLWEPDRLIGAVDGETWVAGASAYSMHLTVPGGTVRAAGLSDVGVAPTHRRRGILTRMMRWLLDQAAERGEPLSILHASEGAIYPHFGFGLATLQGSFETDRSAIRFARPAEPLGRIRLVEGDEAMRLVPPIFEAVGRTRVGEVNRTPEKWRLQILADDPWRRNVGHQEHRAARGRWRAARLRDLPEQERLGRARTEGHPDDRRGDRPRRRGRARALGMAGRHRPRAQRSSPGARPCRTRCSCRSTTRAASA